MIEMNENNKHDAWHMLENVLSRIDEKLIEIEYRLRKLEGGQSSNVILEEKHVPEQRKGILEGKMISSSQGGIERVITLPVCDVCGARLGEKFVACPSCARKLCDVCSIKFDNRNYCLSCLRNRIDLPKRTFLVLHSIASTVTSEKTISHVTKVPKDEVRACLEELLTLKLIEKKGLSVFSNYSVTDDGMSVLSAYKQVYASDDVAQFYSELRKISSHLKGDMT
jgi:hypothetical protein